MTHRLYEAFIKRKQKETEQRQRERRAAFLLALDGHSSQKVLPGLAVVLTMFFQVVCCRAVSKPASKARPLVVKVQGSKASFSCLLLFALPLVLSADPLRSYHALHLSVMSFFALL